MMGLLALRAVLDKLTNVPTWVWLILAELLIVGTTYHLGRSHERKLADAEMAAYKAAQVAQTVVITKKEIQVVTEIQVEYRDRIKEIYITGAEIEKHIKDFVTPADDARFGVNTGFVRNLDAAWAGQPAGPAADSDRESAAVPLSEVAAVEAANATSCRAWREQTLGWRDFYARQQVAINGRAGDWYKNSGAEDMQDNTPITAREGTIGATP